MEDLFNLIKLLDKKERAHFRKYVSDKESVYLQLFEAFSTQKKVNETLAFSKLSLKENKTNKAVIKNYLYNQLVASLVDYQQYRVPDLISYRYLESAKMLYEKGLFNQSHKFLKRALKDAEEQENYEFITAIFNYWQNMEYALLGHSSLKNIEDFEKKRRAFNEKYFFLNNIKYVYGRAFFLSRISQLRITESEMSEYNAMLDHPVLLEKPAYDSTLILHYYYGAKCIIYNGLNDYKKAYIYAKYWYNNWMADKELIKFHENDFINALQIINDTIFNNFSFDLYDEVIQFNYDNFLISIASKARIEFILANSKIKYYNKFALYEKLEQEIDKEVNYFNNNHYFIGIDMKLKYAGTYMISYFVIGKIDNSLLWLQKVKEWNKDLKREDLQNFYAFFEMLIILEINQIVLLRNKAKTVYQYFYQKRQLRPIEKDLLLCLKKASIIATRQSVHEFYKETYNVLAKYKNDGQQQYWFKYFNFWAWFESKVQNVTYKDFIKAIVAEKGVHKSYNTADI